MILSPNFTLLEMTRSQTALRLGIDNAPPMAQLANLITLCGDLLEPVRKLLGVPLFVSSGYRCPALNVHIGGAPQSAHMDGCAADVVPAGLDLFGAFNQIRAYALLPIDQCIIECGAWLHLAMPAAGVQPRHQFMTATGVPGRWEYAIV